jgi:hypothetical protein
MSVTPLASRLRRRLLQYAIALGAAGIAPVRAIDAGALRIGYQKGPETFSFYEASRKFANRAPQQLSLLLDALAVAGVWAVAHPLAVAELLAPQVRLPVGVVEAWQRRARYGVWPGRLERRRPTFHCCRATES